MTRIPDFTTLDLGTPSAGAAAAAPAPVETWMSPEGIPVKPVYSSADTAELDFLGTWPGIAP